ncbi:CzcE family metal-binding protein [Denitratisoma oestradiolicum]|uniref:CzcE family metal-binding protein n=1 Tax=Denitratisoma oestradiolicum TaxID=311182 RepID=A0A6S6Y921_9PROT|nr:CzcE family metal-binding protein [Denitratisoma oestradiolicum]TWO82090.1 hypothetical protein CBW56_01225 [Denitratisoma oestradiolicum]CAB1369020.1 conserved exported protein of unknown function [Denitratisoma oestradiolicum]
MKTTLTKIALIASLSAIGTTAALAHEDYSEGGSLHWLSHASESKSQPTANQLAPFGYQSTGTAARVVSVDADTKYLNVTRLETVQIKAGGKTVTWMFDTRGTAPFPLSKIIPGTDGVTVYVAENPAYIGG